MLMNRFSARTVFLFIGNFLGEELYFRGYLMKKIAFLGNSAWIVKHGRL
jgi:membrane protease YdiL (CAAX protease family)